MIDRRDELLQCPSNNNAEWVRMKNQTLFPEIMECAAEGKKLLRKCSCFLVQDRKYGICLLFSGGHAARRSCKVGKRGIWSTMRRNIASSCWVFSWTSSNIGNVMDNEGASKGNAKESSEAHRAA